MIAAVLDLGPGMVAVATPIVTALTVWVGNRKTRREFSPNGGSSMRDAVDRIERRQIATDDRLTAIEDRLTAEEQRE